MGYPGYNSAVQKEYIIMSWIWGSVHLTHLMRVVFACVLLVCFMFICQEKWYYWNCWWTVSCFIIWTLITPGTLWNILLRRLSTGDLNIWTLDDLTFNIRVYRTETRLTCQCFVAYLCEVSRVCIPLWHMGVYSLGATPPPPCQTITPRLVARIFTREGLTFQSPPIAFPSCPAPSLLSFLFTPVLSPTQSGEQCKLRKRGPRRSPGCKCMMTHLQLS